MICGIICIDCFLCMSHLDIVHMLSAYVHVIHYLGICVLCAHYLQWSLIYSFLTDNADVIHMSSLELFIYPFMYNLVSAHCLQKCTLSMSFTCCPHMSMSMSSVYCLEMHMLCTCHLYCCYLHMYMSSAYYLSICILCAHYLQWSFIYSFLTDNTSVIHMSSLVLFIYPIMYNLVSAHCLQKCTLSMSFTCCPHMYMSFACHL